MDFRKAGKQLLAGSGGTLAAYLLVTATTADTNAKNNTRAIHKVERRVDVMDDRLRNIEIAVGVPKEKIKPSTLIEPDFLGEEVE